MRESYLNYSIVLIAISCLALAGQEVAIGIYSLINLLPYLSIALSIDSSGRM